MRLSYWASRRACSSVYRWPPAVKNTICGAGRYADLRPVVGSEQGGIRPVIVVQNEAGNRHSSTVIIAAITSKMKRPKLPTHIMLDSSSCDIAKDSVILLEQLRTIDKQRLKEKVCHVDADVLRRVDEALKISLELA